ncbi:4Fe-4S ferredoxin iron-sulfur binding domain protein [Shewanella halifaxensis HAW-EB4]|uniref:4Fe-4S ferredoxin iron-sulfur binding domain protein n=1 Tax=Shewanella halifaxensis (strain HAW-EB4) TaxID=458817 RepID=B0TMI9_SHEHH|nr:Coenzyme F420 hydrogenase/dehydrogenase, beta subunit C-terminal domain [Shewanella halifaxensis]ABZ76058.1 4Fe-4S ferredoxin iron-sulfur binding domain protein [Shewanella halifaxensis HAW-EB4]
MNCGELINAVVKNDMCIGCGVCAAYCKSNSIEMKVNQYGFYTANPVGQCNCEGKCIKVCPFNPEPDELIKTEDEIAKVFLTETTKQHRKIGRYINTYVGFSLKHRAKSSSGGIATYTLTKLMQRGEIQHVISVKSDDNPNAHYEYSISSNIEELNNAAKTKYYPVTLAVALKKIKELDGKVAIVGVACFIKAIRLAQREDHYFQNKIGFLVGIICGGVKSTFFAEYLASKAGVSANEFSKPQFRIKDSTSTASDYSFGCLDKENSHKNIKMKAVGDMWGTGLFKANACDFCDDVTTELADISLGDAWLEPYSNDGLGTNVIVTRSTLADEIITNGNENGDLSIEILPESVFLNSQQGSFNHRHDGLGFRIKSKTDRANLIPPKRFDNVKISPLLKLIQLFRMKSRAKSLELWANNKSAVEFDNDISSCLFTLKFFTKINHYQRAILRRIKNIL